MKKIVVAITGSSGSIYAKTLLDTLVTLGSQLDAVGIVFSDNARLNWELEIGPVDLSPYPFQFYEKNDTLCQRFRPVRHDDRMSLFHGNPGAYCHRYQQ